MSIKVRTSPTVEMVTIAWTDRYGDRQYLVRKAGQSAQAARNLMRLADEGNVSDIIATDSRSNDVTFSIPEFCVVPA